MPEFALNLPAIFWTSFLVCFSGALAPGPMLVLVVRESVRHGLVAGPLASTGHAALELLVVGLLLLGLGQWLRAPVVAAIIGIVGGLFLLWMAWGTVRASGEFPLGAPKSHPRPQQSRLGPVVEGVLASLSNPYWFIWWITVGLVFLTRSLPLGFLGVGAFYLGHILGDYAWYTLVSTAIASGRRVMGPKVYRGILLACAIFLAGLGGYFLFSGVWRLSSG